MLGNKIIESVTITVIIFMILAAIVFYGSIGYAIIHFIYKFL